MYYVAGGLTAFDLWTRGSRIAGLLPVSWTTYSAVQVADKPTRHNVVFITLETDERLFTLGMRKLASHTLFILYRLVRVVNVSVLKTSYTAVAFSWAVENGLTVRFVKSARGLTRLVTVLSRCGGSNAAYSSFRLRRATWMFAWATLHPS